MLHDNSDEIKTNFDVTDKTDEIKDAANVNKYAEEVMMIDAICTFLDKKTALKSPESYFR